MNRLCKWCGKEVDSKKKYYCNESCKDKFRWRKRRVIKEFIPVKKNCLFCGKEFFSVSPKNPNGSKYCNKECSRKHWRKLNPEKEKAQQERTRMKRYSNPIYHEFYKKRNSEWIKLPKYRYTRYKSQAKNRNYSFNLSFEQFMTFWGKDCHYCGDNIKGVGIDRIDNFIGYDLENCVPCCEDCNRMKNIKSTNDFIEKCKKILNNFKK